MIPNEGEGCLNSSPMLEVSSGGEIFLLDPDSGKMVIYNHKGSIMRHFKFAMKGVLFIPTAFSLFGEKLIVCQEDAVVLASPIDGHIFK